MDQARSLRSKAADEEARRDQAALDAEAADRDAARAREDASGYAAEARQQRQEADTTDGDEAEVLRGYAQDNDLRERDALSAAQSDDERAAELRATADRYADEAQRLYAEADTAEQDAERQAEEDKHHLLRREVGLDVAEHIIGGEDL